MHRLSAHANNRYSPDTYKTSQSFEKWHFADILRDAFLFAFVPSKHWQAMAPPHLPESRRNRFNVFKGNST
jgi:hypothetical protein